MRKVPGLTGFSAPRRANDFGLNRLEVFHVGFHRQVTEEKVTDERAQRHGHENVTVEHHNSQHQRIIQDIVEEKERNFFHCVDNFTQNWLLEN